jgi:hypothetical protein
MFFKWVFGSHHGKGGRSLVVVGGNITLGLGQKQMPLLRNTLSNIDAIFVSKYLHSIVDELWESLAELRRQASRRIQWMVDKGGLRSLKVD